MEFIRYYKFKPVNKYLIDALVKSQLYFASPAELNDPYDCIIDVRKAFQRAIDKSGPNRADELTLLSQNPEFWSIIDSAEKSLGVFSACKRPLSSAMWAHYAQGHQGVCICYEIPKWFIMDGDNECFGFGSIFYDDDSLTNWLIEVKGLNSSMIPESAIEIRHEQLFMKGSSWAFEEEIRIVRYISGTLDIDVEFVRAIYFGIRTSESDQQLIRELVTGRYPNISLGFAMRSETDAGLTIEYE